MTAKDMAQKHHDKDTKEYRAGDGPISYKFTKKEFRAFCEQLCKEQREKCSDYRFMRRLNKVSGVYVHINDVLNAPSPEIKEIK